MVSQLEIRSGKPRANGCSFCRAVSDHSRRDQCPKYQEYCSQYTLKENNPRKNSNALTKLINTLGNSTVYKTEVASPTLASLVLQEEDLHQHAVPQNAMHVVVLRQFFSIEYAQWVGGLRSRRYGNNNGLCVPNTNCVVECKFLDSQAEVIEQEEKDTFLPFTTVRTWLTSKGSTLHRRVFCNLKAPTTGNVTNPYGDEAFTALI